MNVNPELLKYIFPEDLYILDDPAPDPVPQKVEPQEPAKVQEVTKVQAQEPVLFYGQNEKGILLLVDSPEGELPGQSEMEFLMKVVESGLRFTKNDLALVNVHVHPVNQVLGEVPYNYIISFGVPLEAVGLGNTKYQLLDHDGNLVLIADELQAISADKSKKKLLWDALKIMFNIT